MSRAASSPTHRRYTVALAIIIAAGAGLRLGYAIRCGVAYDEVFVLGVGLDETVGDTGRLWCDVPVRRSDGITPLWWWVQALPVLSGGGLSLWGLRLWPVVLGVITLGLTWQVAAPRIGRGPAVILLALAAASDMLAFTNARGEFAESLLMAAALPAVCLVGDRRQWGLKGVLWLVLLMTHLGKGLFLVGGLISAECVLLILRRGRALDWGRLATALLLAAGPTLGWLIIAGAVVFHGGSVSTDAGARDSVWQALAAITMDYGRIKGYMVARPLDAALVYADAAIWPTTAVLALPVAVGLIAAVAGALGGRGRGRRAALAIALLPWVMVGLAAVIGRGLLGARFHLLYWPALWLIAATGLWRLRQARRALLVTAGVLWAAAAALAFSWSSWQQGDIRISTLTLVGVALAGMPTVIAVCPPWYWASRWRPAAAALGLLLALTVVLTGPWRWGPAARMEPMAGPEANQGSRLLARIDAARSGAAEYPGPQGRTLNIDLANYFLTKADGTPRDVDRAVHYAELETSRDALDPRAWFYLGLAYQRDGRPVGHVRRAWETCYSLRPDPRVAERLRQLPP